MGESPPLIVDLDSAQSLPRALADLVEPIAAETGRRRDLQGTVALGICDPETMRRLNLEFRGIDAPADVLAFPAGARGPEEADSPIGDIALSLEMATMRARAEGCTQARAFGLLLTHALLHLAGMAHGTEREAAAMEALEDEILRAVGLADAVPSPTS